MPNQSALHDVHNAAGAVFADSPAGPVPDYYQKIESAAGEYTAAREGAALAELPERAVLVSTGPHRQKFLQAVLSNDIAGRQPGEGCRAALMDVKGHLLVILRALVTHDSVLLELPADRLEATESTLTHYRVAAPVRFQVRPTTVLALLGPEVRSMLGRVGLEVPERTEESHVAGRVGGQDVVVARAGDMPCAGHVLHCAPDAARAVWQTLVAAGARPLGRRALEALRVEHGQAWYGPDIDESNLLHETGLLSACHSSAKGCYVGQEVVARLEARGGKVNKALRGLMFDAEVAAGALLTTGDGDEVGRVTTAALSPRLGPIALAYVHRKHFEPGTRLMAVGVSGVVATLPLSE